MLHILNSMFHNVDKIRPVNPTSNVKYVEMCNQIYMNIYIIYNIQKHIRVLTSCIYISKNWRKYKLYIYKY